MVSTRRRCHRRVGHVLQGRYKAILVDQDSYLLELVRYIVLNPVRARLCETVADWPWSSYGAVMGKAAAPDTLVATGLAHAAVDTVTYVYTDPQGTPLAEADASGNITATFDYAPYGSQALGSPPSGPGYTGHVNDPDTGLVYMQARYYDPAVGRFLSEDLVGTAAGNVFNFNRFGYANDNPIVNVDPSGLYSCGSKVSSGDCKNIDGFVKKINDSLKGLKKGSSDYRVLSAVSRFLAG